MTDDGIAEKFKAALERKKAANHKSADRSTASTKGPAPHGSESHLQQFRRKSG